MLFFRGRTLKRRDSSSSIQTKREQAPFAASTRIARACMEVLEERQLLANPVLDPIPDARVPGGKSLIIPLTASDEDGDRLTYTVSSTNDDIDVRMSKSTTWVSMTVSSTGTGADAVTISGEMVFQLFGDFAPETVRSFVNLVKSEFFNGDDFHRLADLDTSSDVSRTAWILQGGQKGTPQFSLNDEYHRDAIFSGKGQLAMAKSAGDDNATTQFFITQSPTRVLDFDYPIFGQMVRGFNVLEEITDKLQPDATEPPTEVPTQTITMTNVRVVKNKTDGVLIVRAPLGETGTVRVRVTDGTSTDSQAFDVRGVRDETNNVANNAEHYLVRPLKDQVIAPTEYFDVKLSAFDLEGDAKLFGAHLVNAGTALHALVENDVLRIVPDAGYRGPIVYDVWTYKPGQSALQSQAADVQRVVFMVGEHPISDVEPQQFDGEVGVEKQDVLLTFRDTNPNGQAGDFTAKINWGDNVVTSNATITEDNGVFRVRGTHNYAVAGNYKVTVTIESNLNVTTPTPAGGRKGILRKVVTNAVVADGALTGTEKVIVGDAASPLPAVTVAEFKSADARDTASNFIVEIKWGDGTVHDSRNTADQVSISGSPALFTVRGTHTYADPDAYVVTVTVTDKESGESVVIESEAFIDRQDFNVGAINDTGGVDEGVTDNFQDDDVTFTDSEADHTYTGKVNWGEGDADDFEDLVIDQAAKTFDLKHTYKESGTYQLTIIITDEDGNTATKQQTVTVGNKPPTVGTLSGQGSAVRGEKVTIKWRDVVDLSEKDTDAVFQYEIDWGDGNKETVADFDKDNRRTTASHVYEKVSFTTDGTVKDTFTIKIRAIDKDMSGVPLSSDTGKSYEIDVKAIELRVDPDVPTISHLYVGGIAQGSADADIETIKVVPHGDGTPGKVVVTIDNKDTLNDLTETHTIPAGGRIIVFGGGDGSSDGNGKDVLIIKAGLTNDAELYGGTGNDKLVGAAGNDILAGGTGNDTLVGEAGNDVIFDGGAADSGVSTPAVDIIQAGDGEDLIFSGTTRDVRKLGVVVVYDNDPASLRAISAEWTRSDISYADRLDHLTGKTTGGLNGRVVLSDENVSDDFRPDHINGEGGRDAFFYGNYTVSEGFADILKDREKGERGIAHS